MFLIFQDLVAPSADRRETLPLDLYLAEFYNASPKLLFPKKIGAKNAKFGAILRNFRLRQRISLERVKISKIGMICDRERFLMRSAKKYGELWSTIHKVGHVSLANQNRLFRETIFRLLGGAGTSNFHSC